MQIQWLVLDVFTFVYSEMVSVYDIFAKSTNYHIIRYNKKRIITLIKSTSTFWLRGKQYARDHAATILCVHQDNNIDNGDYYH